MPLFFLNYKFATMKKIKFIIKLVVLVFLSTYGCSSSDNVSENNNNNNNTTIVPTNLTVTVDIQGQDVENPNGDGSGVYSLSANADNAVNYGFTVGNSQEVLRPSGDFSSEVYSAGINQFPVTVTAYSSSDEQINTIKNLTIFVDEDSNGGSGNNGVLVWSDEFEGNGAINTSYWNYELGAGGWGNQEVQNYTNSLENVYQDNGTLKIKVIKDSNGNYSSGRITTKNKFDFKYGRVDIRAKLPSVAGTWPALWMLGANYSSVGWPYCGEIDIMEQFEDKTYVQSTCHWNNNNNTASYGQSINLSTPTEFHVYSLIWTADSVRTLLDGNEFYAMNTNSSMPFDANFFFILNVAMGGTNGGPIDPNFTTDTMEVDYIKVFQ